MFNFFKNSIIWALGIMTTILAFVTEATFGEYPFKGFENFTIKPNILIFINRTFTFIIVLLILMLTYSILLYLRKEFVIKGKNYIINIIYGDITSMDMNTYKVVIPFDECFTTKVGTAPEDINPSSICGQFLKKNPIYNIASLINRSGLLPANGKSQWNNSTKYDSGKLVPSGNYLLMSFSKLDSNGLGRISYDEFIDCLNILWQEIDKYYGQKDICIPVLGSGATRMDGSSLSQQELLDVIIGSYKLSAHKIKTPNALYIVCKKRDDFSLNKIGNYV